jgi:anti-sigma regulatory factor (Ser/Thr protein kinase)
MTSLATAPVRRVAGITSLTARTVERTYEPCACGDPAGVLRHAREDTTASCRAWGFSADCAADAAFAVHECITNGFRHGTPPVTVRLTARPSGVTVTVRDKGTFIPKPVTGDEHRHGLGIIRELSAGDLDIQNDASGTTVTFTIPAAAPRGTDPDPASAVPAQVAA